MKFTLWIAPCAFIFFGFGCRQTNDQIPLVSVDIYLNINEPSNFNIAAVGGFDYYTGGSEGIIVYRNNIDEFNAYDRHAPYNVDDHCRVVVLDDNVIVEDPCSESQWVITDGSIVRGPTSQPLHKYQTTFNDPILHIYN